MKKTLFILATMVAAAVAAEASTVLISFGINSGNGTAVVDGTYLGEPGQKVNKISTGQSNSYTSGTLVTTGGGSTGITLTTGGLCCGGPGAMTDAAAKGSALGQGNKFYDVFGQDMTTGNPMGGVINGNSANGNFTMSLNNLSAGTYTNPAQYPVPGRKRQHQCPGAGLRSGTGHGQPRPAGPGRSADAPQTGINPASFFIKLRPFFYKASGA